MCGTLRYILHIIYQPRQILASFLTNRCTSTGSAKRPISVKEFDFRGVEDISSNGFIIYPIFMCSYCKKTKSSLEVKDLHQMGFPSFLLRRCPVVPFSKTTYTVELAELIMTLMTSELGAGQISTFISKRRTAYWAASARVYLEATMVSMERYSFRGNLSSYGFSRVKEVMEPFPSLLSHCDGFGGSSRNIQRFFIAGSDHIGEFADRFMMSLGGQVIIGLWSCGGLWSCVQPRRKSNSQTITLFCDRHFTNANKKSKLKTEKKKMMTMTKDEHEDYLIRVNSQSRERKQSQERKPR